ncbi:MAG: hypothetical protein COA96_13940 [SAR86 cluster bacterium]|uniref:Uncharacterized protein n=1 Tax=SAR86 cluster bacterium TaxID=2030880 RepID=A0A2A5ATL0_9GAMM|nr:MAG: hypothetical protein COA96_13940 [SAR86 cluster bacterium]
MIKSIRPITNFVLLPAILLLTPVSVLASWTRSYVIEWNELAHYYGADTGVVEPGTDCPQGTNPEFNWVEVLINAGYTREEAQWLRNPANPTRSPVHGQNQMAFRGKDRANVYINPESYPDTGLIGVSGNIGEGINLDGNEDTGFVSPTGEAGIDNTFYKTLGCWKTYRGPERLSSGALQFNDGMRNGSWTMVIVVSGEGVDPMNDDNVMVGFYMSPDDMVKGGDGNVVEDYTFRIEPHKKYEGLFPARTENGIIVSTEPVTAMLRDPGYTRDLELQEAQIKLEMKPDGSLRGYVGGYRPWRPVYDGWVNARGPVIEALTWVELPSVYYALKKTADYPAAAAQSDRTHISYALRVEALPAFVVSPDASEVVKKVVSYKDQAPQLTEPSRGLFSRIQIVDGIVIDSRLEHRAGPDAIILPSSNP